MKKTPKISVYCESFGIMEKQYTDISISVRKLLVSVNHQSVDHLLTAIY